MVEKEEAHFDTEISEHDIPGEWKLRGQVLTRSPVRYLEKVILLLLIKSSPGFLMYLLFFSQTCDIKAEAGKRFLTLKNVQLDQAGEVSYQALNAITSAMLTVKGTNLFQTH